jgi:TonB-linked SusC/RagA family outer membrane protein
MQKKLLRLIKMMSIYSTVGLCMQVVFLNILLAGNLSAQKPESIEDVSIAINLKNASLEEAFRQIESKTDYRFAFDYRDLDPSVTLNLKYQKTSLKNILLNISKEASLRFRQVNFDIDVKKMDGDARNQRAGAVEVVLQGSTVTGKVISDEDQEGLPGVNVIVKGTNQGTVTDLNGLYSVEVPSATSVLQFSSVGFVPEEVEVGNRSVIDLTMSPDITALEEIVVVGYGTQEKSDLTGAVVRADIDAFRESPNVNIAQSLQGTVPGLNIGQVDAAGETPSISVRGRTSLGGNQDVLIVVDGIIYTGSLNDLNPNDIEAIDILKDPSSMAIFGAQSANGVIIVTTKSGGRKAQKPVFNYTGSYTFQNPTNSITTMNREEFLAKSFDADWERAFLPPDYIERDPNVTYLDIVGDPELREGYENGYDFDWYEEGTNPSYINSHNLSMRGSGERTSYFLSGSYTDQKGFIMNDRFKRITARINVETEILDWFSIGAQTFGSFADHSGDSPNLGSLTRMTPLVRPFDEDGELILNPNGSNTANPFITSSSDDFDNRNSLFGNFYADIDAPFLKGLNYRLNFGNNYSWDRQYQSNVYAEGATGAAMKRFRNWYDMTLDNIVSYKRTFDKIHKVDLTLVAGWRERKYDDFEASGTNYNNLSLSYNDLSLATNRFIESDAWDESYLYQMARLNYEFNYRYLLTATIRRDGFSGFARNEKTVYFPSIGLGWVVSEEAFLSDVEAVNNLKFRVSYGKNGNLVNRYESLARLNIYPAYVFGDGGSTLFGQEPTEIENANLTWETTTGFNFGLDFAFLNNRISGSIDAYRTTTNDLIYELEIPSVVGVENTITNLGELQNRGIELALNTRPVETADFSWNLNFNISSNQNEVVSIYGRDRDGDGREDDLPGSGLFIGEPIGAIFTYESAGIMQLGEEDIPSGFFVGTHRIVDQNDDGFIDPADRVIIGREEPAYQFGILNEFNYKDFTFRFFINSVQGGRNGYLSRNMPDGFGSADNIRRNNIWNEIDYWTPANPDARYRRIDQEPATDFIYYGDRSFVRLQDVTLAYNFPNAVVQNIGLRNLKLFVSGKNLLTITDWEGWDPETNNGIRDGGRPVLRGYSIGLDVSF